MSSAGRTPFNRLRRILAANGSTDRIIGTGLTSMRRERTLEIVYKEFSELPTQRSTPYHPRSLLMVNRLFALKPAGVEAQLGIHRRLPVAAEKVRYARNTNPRPFSSFLSISICPENLNARRETRTPTLFNGPHRFLRNPIEHPCGSYCCIGAPNRARVLDPPT